MAIWAAVRRGCSSWSAPALGGLRLRAMCAMAQVDRCTRRPRLRITRSRVEKEEKKGFRRGAS